MNLAQVLLELYEGCSDEDFPRMERLLQESPPSPQVHNAAEILLALKRMEEAEKAE